MKCVKNSVPYSFYAIAGNGEEYTHTVYECVCANCDETVEERFDEQGE